jgi:hypothetical protein
MARKKQRRKTNRQTEEGGLHQQAQQFVQLVFAFYTAPVQ